MERHWRDASGTRRRLARILAAQLRSSGRRRRNRVVALRRLVALEAKDYLPLIEKRFDELEKKTVNLEFADLRLQLLHVLAAWLPDQEIVPFLMAVDSDIDEAPLVRFRAAVLLCERGDAPSVAHIVKQHFPQAKKTKSLTVEALRKSLRDRRLFASDDEFDSLKQVAPEELSRIQTGVQLAQYLYHYQQRGKLRQLSVAEVRVAEGQITGIRFRLSAASEGWSFELRKKGEWWLPHDYRMTVIR